MTLLDSISGSFLMGTGPWASFSGFGVARVYPAVGVLSDPNRPNRIDITLKRAGRAVKGDCVAVSSIRSGRWS